ncbi:eCIS core domain-containing protein [Chitinophaga sp. 22321]|uniref:DUF4157 domain-containing protein n=1 Tax=Chitinophaga hostae TaxID=2831022 RepID=A0ABS5J442_9BACT|nr:DUF4157 domain-containing protein [Chitinophaga hostae]MBS0029993.1 DUF4157 domain-containing protein [Chitinophaga hostae]
MALKKQLRKKKNKGEGKPVQQFIQAEHSQEAAEGNALFFPPGAKPQAKLKVSNPGDPQEEEADKAADKVVQRAPADSHSMDQRDDEKQIATKKEGSAASQATHMPGAIPRAGGNTLPAATAAEMSSSFGYDFGKVRIHTDPQAQSAAQQLQAQAFTYNGEIYFNKDKYNPGSQEGKWLLAHELTHVVQQQGHELSVIQKKDVPEISTPVPKGMKTEKDDTGNVLQATGNVGKVKIIILPDTTGDVPAGKSAVTKITHSVSTPDADTTNGKVSKINGKATLEITIQTVYAADVSPKSTSAYGRGTTKADEKSGNTSLRFHEGSHGTFVLTYLAAHPVPVFGGFVGQSEEKFSEASDKYLEKVDEYMTKLDAANEKAVDCVGTKEASCKP